MDQDPNSSGVTQNQTNEIASQVTTNASPHKSILFMFAIILGVISFFVYGFMSAFAAIMSTDSGNGVSSLAINAFIISLSVPPILVAVNTYLYRKNQRVTISKYLLAVPIISIILLFTPIIVLLGWSTVNTFESNIPTKVTVSKVSGSDFTKVENMIPTGYTLVDETKVVVNGRKPEQTINVLTLNDQKRNIEFLIQLSTDFSKSYYKDADAQIKDNVSAFENTAIFAGDYMVTNSNGKIVSEYSPRELSSSYSTWNTSFSVLDKKDFDKYLNLVVGEHDNYHNPSVVYASDESTPWHKI